MGPNVAIIPARLSSSRFPRKILETIEGKTVLEHLIMRYRTSKRIDTLIMATSDDPSDDDIEAVCKTWRVPCYRGSLDDVVARMDEALQEFAPDADYVFRALGDMLLVDIPLLDWRFDLLHRHGADVIWTGLYSDPWPVYGSRESPWSRNAWRRIVRESTGNEREHVGQFLYRSMHQFFVVLTEGLRNEYYQDVRFELDTKADLAFFRAVWYDLYGGPGTPSTLDALTLVGRKPELLKLNYNVEEKSLTRVNFRRRGVAWCCEKCGAEPMRTGPINRGEMITECGNCGAKRHFKELPAFLAGRKQ